MEAVLYAGVIVVAWEAIGLLLIWIGKKKAALKISAAEVQQERSIEVTTF
jgi:hypothetical protein